ncbi:MAG: gluconate 2-dehydrogenase subunit 3 family protein [Halobacteriota archaeon]
MELRRRDALAALAAMGLAGCLDTSDVEVDDSTVDGLTAVARTVYPDEVDVDRDFVETLVVGRSGARDGHQSAIRSAVDDLDEAARELEGSRLVELEADDVDGLLRRLGCETAEPKPDGSLAERLRFNLVNELLYAFYTSPVGGRLVGIENPIGHPGGLESYTRAEVE